MSAADRKVSMGIVTFTMPLTSRPLLIDALCSGDCPTKGVTSYTVRSESVRIRGTYDACVDVMIFLAAFGAVDASELVLS